MAAVATAALLFTIASCKLQPAGLEGGATASSVAMTWEHATVYLPDSFFPTTPGGIQLDRRLPVVIYLHGCTGITYTHDAAWGRFIKSLGFIAVMPDSMARPGRRSNCDPVYKTTGLFPQAAAMRDEEISYALQRIVNASWADPRNVFLMGHSEGGAAAARAASRDFRGIIISSWTCTNRRSANFDGISAPLETPVLALAWDHDAWYAGKATEGVCADKFGSRKDARQVLFKGAEHATYQEREARDAVEHFLRDHLVH